MNSTSSPYIDPLINECKRLITQNGGSVDKAKASFTIWLDSRYLKDLQLACKHLGLNTSGRKAEVAQRLTEAVFKLPSVSLHQKNKENVNPNALRIPEINTKTTAPQPKSVTTIFGCS